MLGFILQTSQGTLTQGQQLGSFLKSGICPPQNPHFHPSAVVVRCHQKYPKEVPLASPLNSRPVLRSGAAFLAVWGGPGRACPRVTVGLPSAAPRPGACCAPFSPIFHARAIQPPFSASQCAGENGPSASTGAHNLPGSLLLEAPPVHAVRKQQDTTLYWAPNPSDTQGKEVAGL